MKSAKELMGEISMAKQKYDAVVASGQPTGTARERLKNLLFSYMPDILEAINKAMQLTEENELLQTELDDAEHEIDELKGMQSKPEVEEKPPVVRGKRAKTIVAEVPPDEQPSEQ